MRSLRRIVCLGALSLLAPFVPGVAGADVEPLPDGDDTHLALFSDVPEGAWFETPVAWLVQEGITGGVGNGRYGATDNVTRAQMAAFLYRAAGSPTSLHQLERLTSAVAGNLVDGDPLPAEWSGESSVVDALNAVVAPPSFAPGSARLVTDLTAEGLRETNPTLVALADMQDIGACAATMVLPGTGGFVRNVRCVAEAETADGTTVTIELVMITEIFDLLLSPGQSPTDSEVEFLFLESISIS